MILIAIAAIAVVGFVSHRVGVSEGEQRARTRKEDAAAWICPTCAALVEPARRLRDLGGRVSGFEWFNHTEPATDPCDDANAIIRIADAHVRRLERRGHLA